MNTNGLTAMLSMVLMGYRRVAVDGEDYWFTTHYPSIAACESAAHLLTASQELFYSYITEKDEFIPTEDEGFELVREQDGRTAILAVDDEGDITLAFFEAEGTPKIHWVERTLAGMKGAFMLRALYLDKCTVIDDALPVEPVEDDDPPREIPELKSLFGELKGQDR